MKQCLHSKLSIFVFVFSRLENRISDVISNVMFIATLFTIEKIWKQPSCLLTDEWIKKIHTHTRVLFSHGKEENPAICDNIGRPKSSKRSEADRGKSEKDKYCTTSFICTI